MIYRFATALLSADSVCTRIAIASVFAFMVVSARAEANMRPAWLVDGAWSSSAEASVRPKGLRLVSESLTVEMPEIVKNDFTAEGNFARVLVRYRFYAAHPVPSVPIEFLAPAVARPQVQVNGAEVPLGRVAAQEFEGQRDLLRRLARHRSRWAPDRYRRFFEALEIATYQQIEVGALIQEPEETARELTPKGYDVLRRLARYTPAEQFTFSASLHPGQNEIVIAYEQRLSADEVAPHYGDFHFEKAFLGFDYLLYPANSWDRAGNFTFEIELRVPHHVEDCWFVERRLPPMVDLNFPLQERRGQHEAIFTGVFEEFPSEIFSVVLSFAEGER